MEKIAGCSCLGVSGGGQLCGACVGSLLPRTVPGTPLDGVALAKSVGAPAATRSLSETGHASPTVAAAATTVARTLRRRSSTSTATGGTGTGESSSGSATDVFDVQSELLGLVLDFFDARDRLSAALRKSLLPGANAGSGPSEDSGKEEAGGGPRMDFGPVPPGCEMASLRIQLGPLGGIKKVAEVVEGSQHCDPDTGRLHVTLPIQPRRAFLKNLPIWPVN